MTTITLCSCVCSPLFKGTDALEILCKLDRLRKVASTTSISSLRCVNRERFERKITNDSTWWLSAAWVLASLWYGAAELSRRRWASFGGRDFSTGCQRSLNSNILLFQHASFTLAWDVNYDHAQAFTDILQSISAAFEREWMRALVRRDVREMTNFTLMPSISSERIFEFRD